MSDRSGLNLHVKHVRTQQLERLDDNTCNKGAPRHKDRRVHTVKLFDELVPKKQRRCLQKIASFDNYDHDASIQNYTINFNLCSFFSLLNTN